jgi:hypothetical protein
MPEKCQSIAWPLPEGQKWISLEVEGRVHVDGSNRYERFPQNGAMEKLFILNPADANDTDLHTGASFQLTTDDQITGSALGSLELPWLSEAASSKHEIGLELQTTDGKILEMMYRVLKRRLLASQEARSAANKGTDPVLLTRPYQGRLTLSAETKWHRSGSDLEQGCLGPTSM